jgi:signal transduction histidine kinase
VIRTPLLNACSNARLARLIFEPRFQYVELADLVAGARDALLADFAAQARKLSQDRGVSRIELIDSIPQFLDDLVEVLAAGEPGLARESSSADHAVERLQLGIEADSVVREYFLIARCVLEAAARAEVTPTFAELRVLLDAIGDGAAVATAEYTRRREADLVRREATHASFLAHEMRNWLSTARFAFDLLRSRGLGEASGELLGVLDNSLRRAGQQLDDALLGQRLRGGVVSPSDIGLRAFCEEIVAEGRPQIQEKNLRVEVAIGEALTLRADPRLLRSALTNLVRNALKFTHPASTVKVRGEIAGNEVMVEVEDECGGLPPSAMERMFTPFTQADQDRTGFGLGLPIARAAAEAQGGSLTVRNIADKGCVFRLSLPLRVQERP